MEFQVHTNSKILRPLPYLGSKANFAHIFDEIMDCQMEKIYDLFGGSGSFSLYACRRFGSENVVYNDNNPVLVNFMKAVRDEPEKLCAIYEEQQDRSSRDHFDGLRNHPLTDGVRGAGKFLYLAKNAFSSKIRFNKKGIFNGTMSKGKKCPNIRVADYKQMSEDMKDMEITCKDYYPYRCMQYSFLYLDPPYIGNPHGHYNGTIGEEMFARYISIVTRTNKIMLSESKVPRLVKQWFPSVHKVKLNRSIQYNTRTFSTEVIATNYKS